MTTAKWRRLRGRTFSDNSMEKDSICVPARDATAFSGSCTVLAGGLTLVSLLLSFPENGSYPKDAETEFLLRSSLFCNKVQVIPIIGVFRKIKIT